MLDAKDRVPLDDGRETEISVKMDAEKNRLEYSMALIGGMVVSTLMGAILPLIVST
jgi:hypothetical protein